MREFTVPDIRCHIWLALLTAARMHMHPILGHSHVHGHVKGTR